MATLRLREGKYCLSTTRSSLYRTWSLPVPGASSSLPSLSRRHTSYSLGKCHQSASPPSMGLGAQVHECWDVSFHGRVAERRVPAFLCPVPPHALSGCTSRMVRIIGCWDRGPDIWKAGSAYTQEALSRMGGWKVAGVVGSCSAAAVAGPDWGCWLGCRRLSKSRAEHPCQVWTRPACGSLDWTLVYYCNEDPFFNVFFSSPHVAELLFFSLDFFCLWNVLDKYAAEMACYWLCTFLVEWKVKKYSISHIKYSVNVI